MTLLEWKPAYELGIPSVDHEHRELIGMINQVYGHLSEASAAEAIEARLEDIYAAIAAHFALEERHMREAKYEEYEAHKDDHEELLDQLLEMMDAFEENPKSGLDGLKLKLGNWFGRHFATFDARLHLKLGDHHHPHD